MSWFRRVKDEDKRQARNFLDNKRLLAEVREQGTGNREQKEELRLKASKAICF
jgi:hypothetical protein